MLNRGAVFKTLTAIGLCCAVAALGGVAGAQMPASPAWAYGLPPADAAPATPARSPAAPASGTSPADLSPKHIPGSPQTFTIAQIRDYWNVGDWFPDEHPPMPSVVVHGRQPHVRGCAMCHMPNGKGRPENAPVAGLPAGYIVQQLLDFKHGLRASADPRKTNTALMIEAAKDMTDAEIQDSASYFSSMKWTPWITVRETATVPKTRLTGNVFFAVPNAGTEPIGDRIIEAPEDAERFELRDPHSGFIAYVPPGSVQNGGRLVLSGGNRTVPCGICHGLDLQGLGPVPGIAGRSPSYIMRQLWDLQRGSRRGEWSALMKPVVEHLTQDDMLNVAAYLSAQGARSR
ncbi:MAG TPA: c-type cytochrome [Vicinamibacterales bacterium]|nr:c-type cytochrome [Vicinamibacterales bacterium]